MEKQNLHAFKELSTGRLVLRALAVTDNAQMAAIRSDDEVNKYISRQPCLSLAEAEAFIRKIQQAVIDDGWFYWAICLEGDDRLIGTVCLWNIDAEKAQAELGYELFPAFQGKGIMTESLEKVISFAFNELRFKRMVAITDRHNVRSLRLLEKFGFVRDTDYLGEAGLLEDELILALTVGLKS